MSRVTLLGEAEDCFAGLVVSLSGNAMHLYIRGAIPVCGLLKVETGQRMYLGEVAAVWPESPGGYTAALMLVEHMLPLAIQSEPEKPPKWSVA